MPRASEATPAIPLKEVKRVKSEIEAVVRQIDRFQSMSPSERRGHFKKHPLDALCTITHPNGGALHCGQLGLEKLASIASVALRVQPTLAARASLGRARDSATKAFADQVLRHPTDITIDTANRLLARCIEDLKNSVVAMEHYFPCVLFVDGTADEVKVGPVTFVRTRKFFRAKRRLFKTSAEAAATSQIGNATTQGAGRIAPDKASMARVRRLHAGAIGRYLEFPWVAVVLVSDCDLQTAERRGHRAAEMALHVLRVLLSPATMTRTGIAWTGPHPAETAHIYADHLGVLHPQVTRHFGLAQPGWQDELRCLDAYTQIFGAALHALVDPAEASPLRQRLLDAVKWFGDAATDTTPSCAVVKYVSAIECSLFGAFHRHDHSKVFASRVQAVLEAFDYDFGRTYERSLKLYEQRSRLLHGAASPRAESVGAILQDAATLARLVLMCAAQVYPILHGLLGVREADHFEAMMQKIQVDGLVFLDDEWRGQTHF